VVHIIEIKKRDEQQETRRLMHMNISTVGNVEDMELPVHRQENRLYQFEGSGNLEAAKEERLMKREYMGERLVPHRQEYSP
jgi:hypothetical protein